MPEPALELGPERESETEEDHESLSEDEETVSWVSQGSGEIPPVAELDEHLLRAARLPQGTGSDS